jgi:hypothetical protein
MDFLNHRDRGYAFLSGFPPFSFTVYSNCMNSSNSKRLREFEEIEISRQSFRGDREYQGGKLLRILSGFRPRIRPLDWL